MRDSVMAVLESYGLRLPNIVQLLDAAVVNDPTIAEDPSTILATIRNTDEYKQRFKGNEQRRARGLPELSPFDYVQLEGQYRLQLRANGMPRGFYDTPEDFSKFIGNDVSPVELNTRLQQGYRAVTEAPIGTKEELKRLYGLNDSDIAAYFLDPERFTQTDVIRKAEAAQRAQAAREQANLALTQAQAEQLAQRTTQAEAQQGFAQIGQMGEVFTPTTEEKQAGQTAIGTQEQIAGVFGISPEAAQRIRKRQRGRTAAFETGGTFATGGSRATGLTTVGE